MLGPIGNGLEFVVRGGSAPFLLGLRWAKLAVERQASETASLGLPSPRHTLALASKVALDEIFLATEFVSATLVSLRDRGRLAQEMGQALDLFEQRGWLDDPAAYHLTPWPPTWTQMDNAGSLGIAYRHMRFESEYEPHAGEPGRDRWLGYRPNQTAHAWLLEHAGEPRPWLVCIPGYRMGHPRVDFTGFRARWLHETLGLNVAIPVLPLHGPRRVGRRGGDGFLSGDFVDTVHAQAQAVWDVRRLIAWLKKEGAPAVGVHGVSLGGHTTVLVASLEHDLDCVIAGIPAIDFLRLATALVPSFVMNGAQRLGFAMEPLETLLRVISPLAFPPSVPRERRYLYAGLADRLASPDHARDLWHHWEKPRVAWYEGTHVSFLWESAVETLLHEALHTCGLLEAKQQTA